MKEIHRDGRYIIHAEVDFDANQSTGGRCYGAEHSHGLLDNADRTTERCTEIVIEGSIK